jgi:FAD-linked oxidoreductase
LKRRQFIAGAGSAGIGAVLGGLGGCSADYPAIEVPREFTPGAPVPWTNWAGNQSCLPDLRMAPATEDEVVAALQAARGVVRAVGSGHSFSAQVPTDGTLISTDRLSGLVEHDPTQLRATVLGGTRLHQLGPMLTGLGQALPNMPDMAYPSIAGGIATAIHGTGTSFGAMHHYVTDLRLATPGGELVECSTTRNPELFNAARTSLGALGIVTRVTLQNQAPFELTETSRLEELEAVLDDLPRRCAAHRHFEFFALPYTSACITVTTDIASPGDTAAGEEDPYAVNTLRALYEALSWVPLIGPAAYRGLLTGILGAEGETRRTGSAHEVLTHARVVRFREMEYTVPADAGPDCLREVLAAIHDNNLPLCFPLEYRYVQADDAWLSMFEGRNGCSISVHQYADLDHSAPFSVVEPIFWKYDGRPHWGKLHTLGADRLAGLYPRHWQDFRELRATLDPHGRMLNAHLRQVLGV